MELTSALVVLLAATEIEELRVGHQSRVFRAVRPNGDIVVAKVLDAAMVDRHDLDARLEVVSALADLDPRVCRPLPIGQRLVTEVALAESKNSYVVCFEFADGTAIDPSEPAEAELMGRTLSGLHTSMSQLPPTGLPLVAALQAALPDQVAAAGQHQLLHGDFNAGNLRKVNGVVKIFDLDDCGYGPPAFDVANALYMVLFDAVVHAAPENYRTFRKSFVSGYVDTSHSSLDDDVLDHLIDLRVDALRGWLDDLDTAPIGIRTASDDWRATLRRFVTNRRLKLR
jgi:Ser/Thr protein kinase RdoA (MazF antagonist)